VCVFSPVVIAAQWIFERW